MILIKNIDIFDILKIVITAILTSGLTYFLSSLKDRKNRAYENRTKLIDEVYDPIMRIIDRTVDPLEGYDGLSANEVNKIIEIIDSHSFIADKKLIDFSWDFKEDIYILGSNNSGRNCFDNNRFFLDYIENEYNKLKKRVNRPYDSSVFKNRRLIKKLRFKIQTKVRALLHHLSYTFKRLNRGN